MITYICATRTTLDHVCLDIVYWPQEYIAFLWYWSINADVISKDSIYRYNLYRGCANMQIGYVNHSRAEARVYIS